MVLEITNFYWYKDIFYYRKLKIRIKGMGVIYHYDKKILFEFQISLCYLNFVLKFVRFFLKKPLYMQFISNYIYLWHWKTRIQSIKLIILLNIKMRNLLTNIEGMKYIRYWSVNLEKNHKCMNFNFKITVCMNLLMDWFVRYNIIK